MPVIVYLLIILLAWWIWSQLRSGRWNKTVQRPDDDWNFIDLRDYSTGHAQLLRTTDGWIVKLVPHDEDEPTTSKWFSNEQQARKAFSSVFDQ